MASQPALELAARKARLIERIGAQREHVAAHAAVLKKPLAAADKLVQGAQLVKQYPWLAGVAVFALVVLRRGGLLRWARRGITLWRGWRFARRWLRDQGYL